MRIRILGFLVALFCCQSVVFAQDESKKPKPKPIIPDYVSASQELPAHPRLLLFKGEEKALKKAIKKDAVWTEISQALIDEANAILDLPENERIKTGKRLLSISRENLRRIYILSYAYRMTGTEAFLKRAEAEMLKAASFSDWNPSHFLDVGEMTMALAIGYDWLYSDLSAQTKETIEQAIIEKGLKPSFDDESKNNWFVTAVHNWNQVCHAGVTYGALVVWEKEPELAQKTVNRAIEMIKIPMQHYAPGGAYPEGPGYWEYGTSFNVMFISAIEKIFGTDFLLSKIPGFMKTGEYILNIGTPALRRFAYSDNSNRTSLSPTMFWFYDKTKDASILYNQARLIARDGVTSIRKERLAPSMVIWGSSSSLENPKKPSSLYWKADGDNPVCFMRSSWDNDSDLFLGVKLGSAKVNHGHMDVGSFIFEANGVDWAMDMGSESYNSLETKGVYLWGKAQDSQRWDVYRYNNLAHNTLTLNLKYQNVDAKAEIDESSDDENHMYVVSDLTEVYAPHVKSAKRAFSLVDKSYAVIEDQIELADRFAMVTWTLMTTAEVQQVSDKVILLEKDGKKMYMKVDAPEPIRWNIAPAKPRFTFDSPISSDVTHVAFDMDLKLHSSQKITVYLIPEENKDVEYKSLL